MCENEVETEVVVTEAHAMLLYEYEKAYYEQRVSDYTETRNKAIALLSASGSLGAIILAAFTFICSKDSLEQLTSRQYWWLADFAIGVLGSCMLSGLFAFSRLWAKSIADLPNPETIAIKFRTDYYAMHIAEVRRLIAEEYAKVSLIYIKELNHPWKAFILKLSQVFLCLSIIGILGFAITLADVTSVNRVKVAVSQNKSVPVVIVKCAHEDVKDVNKSGGRR